MPSSKEIRSSFIDFFRERNHKFVPSSPVVPMGDDTLLFANAGMNQFKDIFLGLTTADHPRAVNSQKCIRVSGKHNDLEEVGVDTYHHTFFEMLGNWSFDDYFKAEAIEWAWEYLVNVLKIDPDKLWATVFAGDNSDGLEPDEEARKLWTKVTPIAADRVLQFGKKDNFWEMGAIGPCGPCSEIHIDLGPDVCDKKNVPGHKCGVNAGCSRFMELWNLVFIQYNRTEDGTLIPLEAKYVDTGAGFERITSVLQNKKSNYDTDLFTPLIAAVAELSGKKYGGKLEDKTDIALRVIADHIRSLTFTITDGATVSNEGRGYVIRRILRRASRFGRELGLHEPFLHKLVDVLIDVMGDAYTELSERADYVKTVIEAEETSFGRALDRGIEIFNTAAEKTVKAGEKTVNGADVFQLYDTYGFPLDLTELMAREKGLTVDTVKFGELMQQQKQRARAAQKTTSIISSLAGVELPVTGDDLKFESDSCRSKILGWITDEGFQTEGKIEKDKRAGLVIEATCFYAESGGQTGDAGIIESNSGKFSVENTEKIAQCVIHQGIVTEGVFTISDEVTATVSKERTVSKKNHTATHILQWALQQIMGKTVTQQGSLVGPDYLRFDFTCPKAPTAKQIIAVEQLVCEKIDENAPVVCEEMPIDEAKKLGAMALFGEKYGETVRVVSIGGKDAYSREFCGGTHVDNTTLISGFKIIKEESISAGVRRITALTGEALAGYLEHRSTITDEVAQMLKVPADGVTERVKKLIEDNKVLTKKLKSAAKSGGSDTMTEAKKLLEACEKIGNSAIIAAKITAVPVEQVRAAIDMLKKKATSAAIVLCFEDDGKVILLSGVTDDLVKRKLSAGDILKVIAPIVGGGGGGRPQMAQAGGKNPQKINEALAKATELIKEKLTAD